MNVVEVEGSAQGLVADDARLREGWRAVYLQESRRLVALATALVGAADAPDLVADAVARVLMRSASLPPVANVGAYLAKAVVNEARHSARSRKRRERREQTAATVDSERSRDLETRFDVERAMSKLSPRQRAVIFLHYWEDLPIPAIATTLDISEGSVRKHLGRAKTTLKEVLDGRHSGNARPDARDRAQ